MNKEYRYLIILLIVFIFYNSFFINKAFHIDDHSTIAMANAVNTNFFKPRLIFIGKPLFLAYYYAPIIKLFGEKEIWLHIFYLPFSLLIIVSMFFLSQRFAGHGLFPILLLVSTPAFIIASHNITLDIPLFAFFLASIASFIYGIDKKSNKVLFLSGILAGTAILTKYTGIMLIPIMLMYSLLFDKRKGLIFLVVPIGILILWIVHNKLLYGYSQLYRLFLFRIKLFLLTADLKRTYACLIFITGTSVNTIFLALRFLGKKQNIILFFLSLAFGLYLFFSHLFLGYLYSEKLLIALFFTFSVFTILVITKTSLKHFRDRFYDKDRLFLILWFLGMFIFTIFSTFVAARYVLLLFPPMFLLIHRQLLREDVSFYKHKSVIALLLLFTFFISTFLAVGDYRFAGIYRDFSARLRKEIPNDKLIYFYSGDWGYNYYMTKEGYMPITYKNLASSSYYFSDTNLLLKLEKVNEALLKEAILVIPNAPVLPTVGFGRREVFLDGLEEHNYKKVLIRRIDYYGHIFLHHLKFHAGFYSYDWGLLPFNFSCKKSVLESFKIYKLNQ